LKIAIYNLHFAALGGGERRTSALAANLASRHDTTLFVHSPVSIQKIKTTFGIDLCNVEIIPLEHKNHSLEIASCRPDLFINNSHASRLSNPARFGIYMCMFPEARLIDLSSYQVITANSRYTAGWIRKKWGYPSEVVYSACQNMGPPTTKKNIILHVARFSATAGTAHQKRQDILLETFKRLVDDGLCDWELHLVGNAGPTNEDKRLADDLRHSARGYPVHIRPNISFDALRDAYRTSSIYWHATGFGALAPSKQEHFGMSIIEAMSAGVVPIALNSGGPRETINHGINGYLWNELSELKSLTCRVIEDRQTLRGMSAAAVIASKSFTVDEFLIRMDRLIERLTKLEWTPPVRRTISINFAQHQARECVFGAARRMRRLLRSSAPRKEMRDHAEYL